MAEDALDLIHQIEADTIPPVEKVFDRVRADLDLDAKSEVAIRENFSDLLRRMMERGLEILETYQANAQRKFLEAMRGDPKQVEAIAKRLLDEALHGGGSFTEKLTKLISEALSELPPLTEFSKSMSNMRMSRSGSMFQRSVKYLLERCGLPSETGPGRTDLVVPDREMRRRHPERAPLLQLKAMHIRERAKTARAEQQRVHGPVWVVTLDEEFGSVALKDLEDMGLRIYCPRAQERFPGREGARPLNDLVTDIEAVAGRRTQTKLSTS